MRTGVKRTQRIEKRIIARRGKIFDRNERSNILALNLAVKDVCADPQVILNSNRVQSIASQLADDLDLPIEFVAGRLDREGRRFAYIKRFVLEEHARKIADRDLTGVFFKDATVRYYPQRSFMCHVLGFVNYEAVGSAGIEQQLDRYLKGSSGLLESEVNALREEMYWRRERWIPALAGADVRVTLDQNVQYIVEKALDEVIEEHGARGAWSIVERVRTGEILAMASRPAFDPNSFRTAGEEEKLNRAVGYVYEPGSTLKVATIAAALNEGTVSPGDVFDCEYGAWLHCRRLLRDFHPYGRLTVADGLKKSSNILTAKVALTLGDQRLYRYLRAFGLGSKRGIDLPGEENGILHPPNRWSGISSSRIAIGQGVALTALQMLGVVCAIANDGFLMRPYVVDSVSRSGGPLLLKCKPEVVARPITGKTAATMRTLLARVTEDGGTGRRARVAGYTVAGKTGTAQKPVNGVYSSSAHVASFVGFLPAENPEIALIVVVDEPRVKHTGGVVAAPVFSRIAGEAVRYLDIPPARYNIAARNQDGRRK